MKSQSPVTSHQSLVISREFSVRSAAGPFALVFTLAATTAVAGQNASGTAVSRLTVAAPRAVVRVDARTINGDPVVLAWSADQSTLYLASVEHSRLGWPKTVRHFLVNVAAGTIARVDAQPDWAAAYWGWKSGRRSPAAPEFMLDVDTQMESKQSVSTPTGGELARGGTIASNEAAGWAANHQVVKVAALKLRGETIGEWRNEVVTPGSNFSWAPAPYHLLAYARRDGGPIVLLDDEAGRQQLTVAKSALLPAWSSSGHELAWLERRSKSQFDIVIAPISAK